MENNIILQMNRLQIIDNRNNELIKKLNKKTIK